MTGSIPILDDDEVAKIATWKTNSYGSMVNLPVAKRDALCNTVRALKAENERLLKLVGHMQFPRGG